MIGITLSMAGNPSQITVIQQAIAVLRRYGQDAHIYLPGASVPVLGAELVTSGTSWVLGGGLTVASGVITGSGGTGALRITPTASTLVIGRTYKVGLTVSAYTSGSISLPYDGTNVQLKSALGSYEFTFVATTNDVYIYNTAFIGTATLASVREITGYTSLMNGLTAANYLDSAGTTAGTVDQPVGLVLDAAGSLGVELVTGAAWSVPAGVSEAGGVITFTSPAAFSSTFQIGNAVIGTTYKVVYEISSYVSGSIKALCGATGGTTRSANGTYEEFLVAGATTSAKQLQVQGSFVGVATMRSVREVTGIAASQPTTASKPILRRGALSIALQSNTPSNGAWLKNSGVTVNGNIVSGATGTAWGVGTINQSVPNTSPSTAYTAAVLIRSSGATRATLYFRDQGNGNLPSSTLTLTSVMQMVVVNMTAAAGTTSLALLIGNTDGDIEWGGAALFRGNLTAQQIQALGGIPLTTTAPASTALGPQYWQFDGSNDSLSLGGPLFQMADDHCVVAGFNAESVVTGNIFFNGGADSTRVVSPFVNAGPSVSNIWRDGAGTGVLQHANTIALNQTYVLSGRRFNGLLETRLNGVLTHSGAVPAFGAAVSTAASIGNNVANGAINFKGSIYPAVAIKGALSDSDQLLINKLVANLSGVQI